MTKEEFLLDTIKYYSEDTLRRCVENGMCTYSGKTLNKNSDGCAIGRWLNEEVRLELDALDNIPVHDDLVYNKLPEWMRNFGKDFLENVQCLHDYDGHWNESGLSQLGNDRVNAMIKDYTLNIPKYK